MENEKHTRSFTEDKISIYNSVLVLYSDGFLGLTRELLSNIECPMNLRDFPHDVQHCKVSFLSFVYNLMELNFAANVSCGRFVSCDEVTVVESSAFKMVGVESSVRPVDYGLPVPNMVVMIIFERQLPYYMYQVISNDNILMYFLRLKIVTVLFVFHKQNCSFFQGFMPTILSVMSSWLIFWIDIDAGNQVSTTIANCF